MRAVTSNHVPPRSFLPAGPASRWTKMMEGERPKSSLRMEEALLRSASSASHEAVPRPCRPPSGPAPALASRDPNRPIGSFMFLGPTGGVGKTEAHEGARRLPVRRTTQRWCRHRHVGGTWRSMPSSPPHRRASGPTSATRGAGGADLEAVRSGARTRSSLFDEIEKAPPPEVFQRPPSKCSTTGG